MTINAEVPYCGINWKAPTCLQHLRTMFTTPPLHMQPTFDATRDTEAVELKPDTPMAPLQPLSKKMYYLRLKPEAAGQNNGKLKLSLQASYKNCGNETRWKRREEAIAHAAAFFKKAEMKDLDRLERETARGTFSYTNKLLDQLFMNCFTMLLPLIWSNSLSFLTSLRLWGMWLCSHFVRQVSDYLIYPFGPWKQEAGVDFITENNFKIFGIAFRAESEHYMKNLMELYDFSTDASRLKLHYCYHINPLQQILSASPYDVDGRRHLGSQPVVSPPTLSSLMHLMIFHNGLNMFMK
ncbi:hypothetical protein V5O48_005829 [Marasmius crinis-equi]|uniref:LAGLIDADG homing endonuclease n=1 Tax=Marasmius crinis-equi TaxID=585013 RepID=A0ABR3FLP6_9AGAR